MYCASEQVVERFGRAVIAQLTSRNGSGEINEEVLDAAIADASAEVDMYLAGRYVLPLSVVPLPLVRIACVLVRDILAVNSDVHDERWQTQSEESRRMLRDISTGRINLGVDALSQSPATPPAGVSMESGGRIWGRDKSRGFM
jgi:phage gp36-like protein